MKRHILALGLVLSLTYFTIFYVSFNVYAISLDKLGLVLRLLLPLFMGGYVLAIGHRRAWLPSSNQARRMLLMTLFPLIALAVVVGSTVSSVTLLVSSLSFTILTSVAAVLFWQGLIWQQMKRGSSLFLQAVRLSLVQIVLVIAFMFIAMVPFVGLHSLWTLLSFLKSLKAFQLLSVIARFLAGLSFILLLAGLLNLALSLMMEWTGSILYPALTYAVTTSLIAIAVQWSVKLSEVGMGFLSPLLALASVGSFIYLYLGAKKINERAQSV